MILQHASKWTDQLHAQNRQQGCHRGFFCYVRVQHALILLSKQQPPSKTELEVLDCPACSPDLDPSEFHLIRPPKEELKRLMICSWQDERRGSMSGFTYTQKPCILMPLKACRLTGKVYWEAR
jgi:hypothetical protein